MNIAVFFHVAVMDGWYEVYTEMKEVLEKNLLNKKIYYLENYCPCETYEFPTLKELYNFTRINPGYKILYLHTKGISRNHKGCIRDWRRSMMFFLIEHHKKCLEKLEEYDTVGCNFMIHREYPHWQGNFWWARSDYIAKLIPAEEITMSDPSKKWSDRHKAEAWIFSGKNTRAWQCYHHHCDPYEDPNPRINYEQNDYSGNKIIQRINTLTIKSALYGIGQDYRDVSEIIKEKYQDEEYPIMRMVVNNETLKGDPCPYIRKKLLLSCVIDGVPQMKIVMEHDLLTLRKKVLYDFSDYKGDETIPSFETSAALLDQGEQD